MLDEYDALLSRAEFAISRVISTPGPSSIIEAVPH